MTHFTDHNVLCQDWSCAPWTVVGLIFGAMILGVPIGQVYNTHDYQLVMRVEKASDNDMRSQHMAETKKAFHL